MQALIEKFLRQLSIERGASKNTVLAYRRDLNRYLSVLDAAQVSDPEKITSALILDYQFQLQQLGLASSSIARALASVRSFHKFLLDESITKQNPAASLKPPKLGMRLPKAISIADIEKLLDSVGASDENTINPILLRDRAILELMYATGARVSEIVALDVDDVLDTELVRLFGKGSKERVVPIGGYAQRALGSYLTRTRPVLNTAGTPALFLNQRGSRLSRQSIWQIISAAASRAELIVSPHTLRHSFATHLLQGGADVRVVQELLGHSSVATTQIYTLVTIDSLREAYLNSHPRSRR